MFFFLLFHRSYQQYCTSGTETSNLFQRKQMNFKYFPTARLRLLIQGWLLLCTIALSMVCILILAPFEHNHAPFCKLVSVPATITTYSIVCFVYGVRFVVIVGAYLINIDLVFKPILEASMNVTAEMGSSAVLICPFYSVPAANVSWHFANSSAIQYNNNRRVKVLSILCCANM